MSDLEGKVVLVTGAAGGIGRESSLLFAEAGARLVLTDLDEEAGNETLDAVSALGGEATFVLADLTSESDIRDLLGRVEKSFGRLDGAFNNAGVAHCGAPLHELTSEQWERALRIDLTAVFWCLKYEIQLMLRASGGAIVNTASGLGMVAMSNASEYVAAKHGVIGLTRAAATEYASRGIRINSVMPGIVQTPMLQQLLLDAQFSAEIDQHKRRHSIGRFGRPREIGEAVKWLLSDAASFVNGTALAVDGGFLAN